MTDDKYNKESLKEYQKDLLDCVRDSSETEPRTFRNERREHNAKIMNIMFMESDSIDMFCGEMSILRDSFYRRIDASSENLGTDLKEELAANIDSFLYANKKLRIFTLRYKPEMVDEFITPELRTHLGKEVEIYVPDQEMSLVPTMAHISVGRKKGHPFMVRVETDQNSHSALCTIRPSEQDIRSIEAQFSILPIGARSYSN